MFVLLKLKTLGVESKNLLPDAEQYLSTLDWYGNVRQLENTCHWLAVMTSGQTIHLSDLPEEIKNRTTNDADQFSHAHTDDWQQSLKNSLTQLLLSGKDNVAGEVISEVEQLLIQAALTQTRGRKNDAAKLLGWGRNTLTRKLKEYNINS